MKLKKKVIAGALAAGLVMGAGGIAAAYFTSSGTGTGTGTTGTAVAFTVTVGAPSGPALTPTQSTTSSIYSTDVQTIGWVIKNDGTNAGHQYLTNVVIRVTTFSAQATTNLPACTQNTFHLTGTTPTFTHPTGTLHTVKVTVKATMNHGENISTSVQLRLINNTLNQDNCENITVPIQVTAT